MGKIATGKVYNKLVMGGFRGCSRPSLIIIFLRILRKIIVSI